MIKKSIKYSVLYLLWDGIIGGATTNAIDLANNKSEIFDLTICLLNKTGTVFNKINNPNVKIIQMNAKSGFTIMAYYRLYKYLKNNHFDIIHNNIRTYLSQLALILTKKRDILIYQEHGDVHSSGESFRSKLGYRVFSKFYNHYFTVSEETRDIMISIGVPSDRIENISNPISLEAFDVSFSRDFAKKALGLDQNKLIVGTACRFVEAKDLPLYLRTAKEIKRRYPNVIFVLVGGGILKKYLLDLVSKLQLDSDVVFLGIRNDMPIVYKAFDIFMLTSYQESFGKTILESLASETPIVATVPQKGGGKILIQEASGILFTHNRDEKILADLVIKYLENSSFRILSGKQGKSWIINKEEYHVKRWITNLENKYKKIIDKNNKMYLLEYKHK